MNDTGIEWCDVSSNALRYRDADGRTVWACAKVSDGCKNCYSEAIAHRYRKGGPFTLQQVRKVTPYFDEAEAGKLLRSKKLAGKRVFIGDMTDVFGEWVPFELLDKLFAVFALRPDVTFQVLTKRPERMAEYLNEKYGMRSRGGANPTNYHVHEAAQHMCSQLQDGSVPGKLGPKIPEPEWRVPRKLWAKFFAFPTGMPWPLPNVWLGTSVEDQQRADERIPHLLRCPAAVRFLSVEPLLGPVDLGSVDIPKPVIPDHRPKVLASMREWRDEHAPGYEPHSDQADNSYALPVGGFTTRIDCLRGTTCNEMGIEYGGGQKVQWVIVGGESGHRARPCNLEWVRSIANQCRAAGVPVFVKQIGSDPYTDNVCTANVWPVPLHIDGDFRPLRPKNSKGGDPSEWPADLRVREMPR